jgi:DNA N-6-adenine-methyltransferase (Dam)
VSTGAANNRHRSKQDVETPRDLLDAVEARFGPLTCDLACTKINAKAKDCFTPTDVIQRPWPSVGILWLNPEYGDIATWSARCAAWRGCHNARLLLLVPASVGSNWYRDHVHGRALVLALNPRVQFVGHTHPYPRDLVLASYGDRPGFGVWQWKRSKT